MSEPTPTTDKLTIANIKARYNSPMPQIFKTIQKILLTIGAIGTAVVVASATLPISLPSIVITIASYMIVSGAVGTGITQLTSTNPPTQQPTE